MDRQELIEVVEGYEKAGWIIVALPPEMAEPLVGTAATPLAGLALSAEIKRLRELAKESGDTA